MTVSRKEYNKLKKQQKQHIIDAVQLLLQKNDTEGTELILEKIKISNEVINISRPRIYPWGFFFLLLITSILYICHKNNPRIHMALHAKEAGFILKYPYKWEPNLKCKSIYLSGNLLITSARSNRDKHKAGYFSMKTYNDNKESKIIIKEIFFDQSEIRISKKNGKVFFNILKGGVSGKFNVNNSNASYDSKGVNLDDISDNISDEVSFEQETEGNDRIELTFEAEDEFSFDRSKISKMNFEINKEEEDGNFFSTIVDGKITLPEIKRTVELEENDYFTSKKVTTSRFRLNFSKEKKDDFSVFFQGSIESPGAGPEGFIENLTPSWLIWIYHNQELGFFWGSLVFAFSLFSGVRNLLKK